MEKKFQDVISCQSYASTSRWEGTYWNELWEKNPHTDAFLGGQYTGLGNFLILAILSKRFLCSLPSRSLAALSKGKQKASH